MGPISFFCYLLLCYLVQILNSSGDQNTAPKAFISNQQRLVNFRAEKKRVFDQNETNSVFCLKKTCLFVFMVFSFFF